MLKIHILCLLPYIRINSMPCHSLQNHMHVMDDVEARRVDGLMKVCPVRHSATWGELTDNGRVATHANVDLRLNQLCMTL